MSTYAKSRRLSDLLHNEISLAGNRVFVSRPCCLECVYHVTHTVKDHIMRYCSLHFIKKIQCQYLNLITNLLHIHIHVYIHTVGPTKEGNHQQPTTVTGDIKMAVYAAESERLFLQSLDVETHLQDYFAIMASPEAMFWS